MAGRRKDFDRGDLFSKIFYKLIGIWLTYKVLVWGVKLIGYIYICMYVYIYIYIFVSISFYHVGYYRILSRLPCVIQQIFLDAFAMKALIRNDMRSNEKDWRSELSPHAKSDLEEQLKGESVKNVYTNHFPRRFKKY